MNTENALLIRRAEVALKGNWPVAIATYAIIAISGITIEFARHESDAIIWVAGAIISGPFALGYAYLSLNISRGMEARVEQLFIGFRYFETAFLAYLLTLVYTLLRLFLFIVPGIIAAISYSMTYYIIADDDSISAVDAIEQSKRMMEGYKWKYFCMKMRFLGWWLLCILTLGIGFLWLGPVMEVSSAKFYEDIKLNGNEVYHSSDLV